MSKPCQGQGYYRPRQKGFSLIELVVAIAILSAIAAITFPAVGRTIDAAEFNTSIEKFQRDVSLLRAQAMLEGRTLSIPVWRDNELIEPAFLAQKQWQITGEAIIIEKTGVCHGKALSFVSPTGRERTVTFHSPDCRQELPS